MRLPPEDERLFYVTWSPPGSRRQRQRQPRPWWATCPSRPVRIDREVVAEVYGIGAVAVAVARSVRQVRRWEARGVLPQSPWVVASPYPPQGLRRVYPVDLIEDIANVAEATGVFDGRPPNDEFVQGVRRAFDRAIARLRSTAPRW